MSTIQLPRYETGKDAGAAAAQAKLATNTTIGDLAYWGDTHRVETAAIVACSMAANLRYDDMQAYKAGFVTGYQGALLAAIAERAAPPALTQQDAENWIWDNAAAYTTPDGEYDAAAITQDAALCYPSLALDWASVTVGVLRDLRAARA